MYIFSSNFYVEKRLRHIAENRQKRNINHVGRILTRNRKLPRIR